MKAGFVARIRVNPRDCLSILDVVQRAGVNVDGMSFSSITSLAVSSMLQAFRKHGVIPDGDGFDFERRMAPFAHGRSTYNKREIAEALYVGAAHGLSVPEINIPQATPQQGQKEERWKIHPDLFEEYKQLDELFPNLDGEQKARRLELRKFLQLY